MKRSYNFADFIPDTDAETADTGILYKSASYLLRPDGQEHEYVSVSAILSDAGASVWVSICYADAPGDSIPGGCFVVDWDDAASGYRANDGDTVYPTALSALLADCRADAERYGEPAAIYGEPAAIRFAAYLRYSALRSAIREAGEFIEGHYDFMAILAAEVPYGQVPHYSCRDCGTDTGSVNAEWCQECLDANIDRLVRQSGGSTSPAASARYAVNYGTPAATYKRGLTFQEMAETVTYLARHGNCDIGVWDDSNGFTLARIPGMPFDAGTGQEDAGTGRDCGYCHRVTYAADGSIHCGYCHRELTADCAVCAVSWCQDDTTGRHVCGEYLKSGRVLVPHRELTAAGSPIANLPRVEFAAPVRFGRCDVDSPRMVRFGRVRGKRAAGSLVRDATGTRMANAYLTDWARRYGPAMARRYSRFVRSPRPRVIYRKQTFRSHYRPNPFRTFRSATTGRILRTWRSCVSLLSGCPAVYCGECGKRQTVSQLLIRVYSPKQSAWWGCTDCADAAGLPWVTSAASWEEICRVGLYR